jgi:phosphoglycolate phosphatase-like HAD superfamily hydrolase
MIRCIVFDFDGTLVDSNQIKRQAFFDITASHAGGIECMSSVLEAGHPHRDAVFREYACRMSGQGILLDSDEMVRVYGELTDKRVSAAETIAGADTLLQWLRASGVHLYLSSSTPIHHLQTIIATRGWQHYFDAIFGLPASKTETLRYLLDANRLLPEQILVIGDGDDDANAARSTGCGFIAVGAGSYYGEDPAPVALQQVRSLIEVLICPDARQSKSALHAGEAGTQP